MPVKGSSSLPALNLQVVEHLYYNIRRTSVSSDVNHSVAVKILNLLLFVKDESCQLSP